MKNKWFRLFVRGVLPLLLLAGAGVFVQQMMQSKPEVAKEAEEKSYKVNVFEVAHGNYHPEVELFGKVAAPRRHLISSEISGRLLRVDVKEGQRVLEKQALLSIDPYQARQNLDRKQLEIDAVHADIRQAQQEDKQDRKEMEVLKRILASKQKQLDAFRHMNKLKLLSDEALEQKFQDSANQELTVQRLAAKIENHEARLDRLQVKLKLGQTEVVRLKRNLASTLVTAPFTGQLVGTLPQPGQNVSVGMRLLELLDTGHKEVQTQLPARIYSKLLSPNGEVLPAQGYIQVGEQRLRLELVRLAGELTAGSAGRTAYFRVLDQPELVLAGQAVRLKLQLPSLAQVVALPRSALFDETRVYLINEDSRELKKLTVEVLGAHQADVETPTVLVRGQGLNDGQRLLNTRIANVTSGMKVAIEGEEPEATEPEIKSESAEQGATPQQETQA
jgi:multidrug efflux pump subunit AcrA (membrane-fusion protein)